MKKNIHPFCHQKKKQEHLADISRFRFKMVPNLGGLKKTKLPPTSPISSFILAWCGPQFSNSLAMTVFSSSSNVSRFSAVALAELDHFPFRFHSQKLENIKKTSHLYPGQPKSTSPVPMVQKKSHPSIFPPGWESLLSRLVPVDSPLQIVVTSHGLCSVMLYCCFIFKHPTNFFTKKCIYPFFNHRFSSTDLGRKKQQHVTLFCPSFFTVEKNLPTFSTCPALDGSVP